MLHVEIGVAWPASLTALHIIGPDVVEEKTGTGFAAIAEYQDGSSADVTARAVWSVQPSDSAAILLPGVLVAGELIEDRVVQIEASFESVTAARAVLLRHETSIGGDSLVVRITGPTLESTYATVESVIVLSGEIEESPEDLDVYWSTDRGESGRSNGDAAWSTAPIPLYEGINIIEIKAADAVGRVGTAELTVVHVRPLAHGEKPLASDPRPRLMCGAMGILPVLGLGLGLTALGRNGIRARIF